MVDMAAQLERADVASGEPGEAVGSGRAIAGYRGHRLGPLGMAEGAQQLKRRSRRTEVA